MFDMAIYSVSIKEFKIMFYKMYFALHKPWMHFKFAKCKQNKPSNVFSLLPVTLEKVSCGMLNLHLFI